MFCIQNVIILPAQHHLWLCYILERIWNKFSNIFECSPVSLQQETESYIFVHSRQVLHTVQTNLLKYGIVVPAIFTFSQPRKNRRPQHARQMVFEISTNCTAPLGLSSSRFKRQPPMKIPIHAPGIATEPAKEDNNTVCQVWLQTLTC